MTVERTKMWVGYLTIINIEGFGAPASPVTTILL